MYPANCSLNWHGSHNTLTAQPQEGHSCRSRKYYLTTPSQLSVPSSLLSIPHHTTNRTTTLLRLSSKQIKKSADNKSHQKNSSAWSASVDNARRGCVRRGVSQSQPIGQWALFLSPKNSSARTATVDKPRWSCVPREASKSMAFLSPKKNSSVRTASVDKPGGVDWNVVPPKSGHYNKTFEGSSSPSICVVSNIS